MLFLFHSSLLFPPFQFFVVKPKISTLTEQRSKVLDKISAQIAAIVIGLPLIGEAKKPLKEIGKSKETGTQITFLPSKVIFSSIKFVGTILIKRMRELAFLNKGIKITFVDGSQKKEKVQDFKFDGGIFVKAAPCAPRIIGGIIGGIRSGTEFDTKNILLESAYFLPSSIRKTARELNVNTDAKYRFERGIDPNSIKEGLEIAAGLIIKICGGEASKFVITGQVSQKNKTIDFSFEKFKTLIGIPILSSEAEKILSSLGFKVKKTKKILKVGIPSWRPDISQDVDLIEELIRIKGFEKIHVIEPEKGRKKETLNFKQCNTQI